MRIESTGIKFMLYKSVLGNYITLKGFLNTIAVLPTLNTTRNALKYDKTIIIYYSIEADYRQITTQADVHIDGEQLAAVRASPVYEEQSVQFTPMMISRVVVHTRSTEELLPVTPDPFFKEPTVDIPLVLENAQKYSEQPEDPKVHVIEELSLAPTANITYEDPLDTALKVIHGVGVLQDISMAVSDDLATSPILPYARRPKRTDPISQERSEVSEDQGNSLITYKHNRITYVIN